MAPWPIASLGPGCALLSSMKFRELWFCCAGKRLAAASCPGRALAGISFVTLSETPEHEKSHRAVFPMAVLLREPQAARAGMATA